MIIRPSATERIGRAMEELDDWVSYSVLSQKERIAQDIRLMRRFRKEKRHPVLAAIDAIHASRRRHPVEWPR